MVKVFMGEHELPEECTDIEFQDGSIHFICNKGHERILYSKLPLFLTSYGEVIISVMQVMVLLDKKHNDIRP